MALGCDSRQRYAYPFQCYCPTANSAWQGEWTAARIELAEDYSGETNLDADIEIPNDADHAPRGSPRRSKAKAVPSGEINSAIAGLDSIKFPTSSLEHAISSAAPSKARKKRSPEKQLTARSNYSQAPVSARSAYVSSRHPDDATATSGFDPHPPSMAPIANFVRSGGKTGGAGKSNANKELFELTDTSTAAMLHEIQVKEEAGFVEHSYSNMHRRLAEEVGCLYKPPVLRLY